jgi:hypothetical protein
LNGLFVLARSIGLIGWVGFQFKIFLSHPFRLSYASR